MGGKTNWKAKAWIRSQSPKYNDHGSGQVPSELQKWFEAN